MAAKNGSKELVGPSALDFRHRGFANDNSRGMVEHNAAADIGPQDVYLRRQKSNFGNKFPAPGGFDAIVNGR